MRRFLFRHFDETYPASDETFHSADETKNLLAKRQTALHKRRKKHNFAADEKTYCNTLLRLVDSH